MEKAQIIFESYNQAVEEIYEKLFETYSGDDVLKLGEDKVNDLVERELEAWGDFPISELDFMTPKEYFKGIDGLENTIRVFRLGAVLCDRGIPKLLMDKMSVFGEEAVNGLLELCTDMELINDEESSLIPITAIRALGKLGEEKAVAPLLELLYSLNEEKENIVEEINDALVNIGIPIIEPIVHRINELERIEYLDEYALNALVRVGENNKDDEIFRCLKSAFGKMEDKILGALCLGDYGDGRAIPALRGYIEKNRASIDKGTFLEIAAAIKRLGGNIDDLVKGTAF